MVLSGYYIDLIKAEYSFGSPVSKIRFLFDKAVNTIGEYENMSKDDILSILSLAIILDNKSSVKKFIYFKKTLINSDRLLNAMSDYILTGSLSWNTDLPINCEYEEIDYIIKNNEKEKNLEKYMDNWYNNHSEYAWYGSHLKSNDTYCGYWSFECAAICKMLGIKDTKLKKKQYFPVV